MYTCIYIYTSVGAQRHVVLLEQAQHHVVLCVPYWHHLNPIVHAYIYIYTYTSVGAQRHVCIYVYICWSTTPRRTSCTGTSPRLSCWANWLPLSIQYPKYISDTCHVSIRRRYKLNRLIPPISFSIVTSMQTHPNMKPFILPSRSWQCPYTIIALIIRILWSQHDSSLNSGIRQVPHFILM